METVSDIIDAFGGTVRFSRLLGIRFPARVSDWRRRESIPADRWARIDELAKAEKVATVSLAVLARIHKREADAA